MDENFLRERDRLISQGSRDAALFSLAREFSMADTVVIAAPFWDLSFPSSLKRYFEQINVIGVTFRYTEQGVPVGLCRANRLIYVTTAGGKIEEDAYGFGYVRALARTFYGIPHVACLKAEGLDLAGADPESILKDAENRAALCLRG